MGAVIVVGVFGAALAAMAIAMRVYTRGRQRDALHRLAGALGGDTDGSGRWRGNRAGALVQLAYTARGVGDNAEYWTEIDAVLPAGHPLSLHVRRHQWRDRGRIERGAMIDIELGDAAFDERFLVEAAPVEIVRRLLDTQTRAYLLAHDRAELATMVVGDRPIVRLAVRTWLVELDEATGAIDALVRIAVRVRNAFADAAEAKPVHEIGSPYRRVVDDRAVRAAAAAWLREVAHVDSVRATRDARGRMSWVVVLAVAALALVLAMLR